MLYQFIYNIFGNRLSIILATGIFFNVANVTATGSTYYTILINSNGADPIFTCIVSKINYNTSFGIILLYVDDKKRQLNCTLTVFGYLTATVLNMKQNLTLH